MKCNAVHQNHTHKHETQYHPTAWTSSSPASDEATGNAVGILWVEITIDLLNCSLVRALYFQSSIGSLTSTLDELGWARAVGQFYAFPSKLFFVAEKAVEHNKFEEQRKACWAVELIISFGACND